MTSDRMKNLQALGNLTSNALKGPIVQPPAPPITVKPPMLTVDRPAATSPKTEIRVPVIPARPQDLRPSAPATPQDAGALGKPLKIKISRVSRFEGQPRRFFDQRSLENLSFSIENEGQEQPIKVCIDKNGGGKFVLIDGERRWRAHHLWWERMKIEGQDADKCEPTIDAFIDTVKDLNEHFRKSVIANLHRQDLSPVDEAAAIAHLSHKGGMTQKAIADLLGKSTAYVFNYLLVNSMPQAVHDLMDPSRPKEQRLTVSAAIDIARSTKADKMRIELSQEAVENNLAQGEIRQLVYRKTGYNYNNDQEYEGSFNASTHLSGRDAHKRHAASLVRVSNILGRELSRTDYDLMYNSKEDVTLALERANTVLDEIVRQATLIKEKIGKV